MFFIFISQFNKSRFCTSFNHIYVCSCAIRLEITYVILVVFTLLLCQFSIQYQVKLEEPMKLRKQIKKTKDLLNEKQKEGWKIKTNKKVPDIQDKLQKNPDNDQKLQKICKCRPTEDKEHNEKKDQATSEENIIISQQLRNQDDDRQLMSYNLELFKNVYSQVGPNWTKMLRILNQEYQVFMGSSASQLKNLFGNSMRRVAKIFENESWKFARRPTKNGKNYLLSMLEIVNQADQIMAQNDLKPNPQSLMQKFKSHVLTLCLTREDPNPQIITQLIQVAKYLGKKMKCYGVFKVKDKRHWKLNKESLEKILYFDGITLNDLQGHTTDLSVQSLVTYDESLNRSWMEKYFSESQVQLKMFDEGKEVKEQDALNLMCEQNKHCFIFF